MKQNVIRRFTKLITSLNSKRYQPSCILINRQNSDAPCSKQRTSHREAHSCEPVNKVKKTLYRNIKNSLLHLLSFHQVIWNNFCGNSKDGRKVFCVQKKIIRIMAIVKRTVPCWELFKKFSTVPLPS
jgi:hypothetical protein